MTINTLAKSRRRLDDVDNYEFTYKAALHLL